MFAMKNSTDEESRDDKKYINADESAAYLFYASMVKNNQKDGDGAQAVNVLAITVNRAL